MGSRRDFLKKSTLASAFLLSGIRTVKPEEENQPNSDSKKPIVVSTWPFGIAANDEAMKLLKQGARALDAVEKGVMVTEADVKVNSVGRGGLPDRDGHLTLDASIIDEKGNCGAVGCLEHIDHPISVARKIMESTPYLLLVGEGALQFALENGFTKQDLLTTESKSTWEEWKKKNNYSPKTVDKGNHDTIGMLAIDLNGDMSGACTTSGLAWKMHGRVGDSPIIGAGLFADNEVGGACCTGKGEANIKIAGTALIVELMRNGKSPQQACEEAIKRVVHKQPDYKTFQLAYLAMNKNGEVGAYAIQKGFQYAVTTDGESKLMDSDYLLK
jgi:N4-(beta-N-acetylglucosaminyl)-L-asparaginase